MISGMPSNSVLKQRKQTQAFFGDERVEQDNVSKKEKYFVLDLVTFIFHRSTSHQTSWRE